MSKRNPDEGPTYRAPALEKGLDILELLAGETEGLTQARIAERLGRTADQLFRMLVCLERRGYLYRARPGDTYHLTSRLFTLSHQHPPTRRLLDVALPIMRALSRQCMQSCHLAMPAPEGMLVVAQVDAPTTMGFAVRQGTMMDRGTTSSGHTYRAFSPFEDEATLPADLGRIRRQGYLKRKSVAVGGITDLCCPVIDQSDQAVAVLTIPYVSLTQGALPVDKVLRALRSSGRRLSEILGGSGAESLQKAANKG